MALWGSSPRITILDVGTTRQFAKSRTAASSHIECVGDPLPRGALSVVVTKDRDEVTRTLLAPTRILHVMSHGDAGNLHSDTRYKALRLFARRFPIDVMIEYCRYYDVWPSVEAVMLDACNTFTREWAWDLAQLVPVGRRITFIGSTESVTWPRATGYTSAFYTSLLTYDLDCDGEELEAAVKDAHRRARSAFKTLTGDEAPFRLKVITGRATR